MKWIFLMAWRDSRRSRRRLLLFSSSVVLGIAALVAIRSFGESMRIAIQENAKSLVGADFVFFDGLLPKIRRHAIGASAWFGRRISVLRRIGNGSAGGLDRFSNTTWRV